MWAFPDLGGGISVYADHYIPTWGPEPTRWEIWRWRLFGWGKPRPKRERVLWMCDGRAYMSPENFALFKQQMEQRT